MFTHAMPLSHFRPSGSPQVQRLVQGTAELITHLTKRGGPSPADYPILNTILQQFSAEGIQKVFSEQDLTTIRNAFGDALSPETIQGWAYHKPLGYAGDFQIIEKIYNYYTSSKAHLAPWDRFFHTQKASQAVRNRLSFFLDQLWRIQTGNPSHSQILNVASGPGRDMYEALNVLGPVKFEIDCIDQDKRAIDYAKTLCRSFLSHIRFTHQNVFRFIPDKTYHLIWSAGLFDYFNDNLFKRMVKRLYTMLKPAGKMVIGNFTVDNPTRGYMELFKWNLFHRSKEHLIRLAQECGLTKDQIGVEQESEGVNLFLIVTRI